ncbi:probable pectinesterase/pectinesterase inhibitor 12 [Typha latifolia]|uniref:probable pectinesterase/pectinesterase inhibitor 12 n=1 Tax=Typha latifolia TaxID=4733 RepID=UPI003C306840
MASSHLLLPFLLLLLLVSASSSARTTSTTFNLSSIHSICQSTPYPNSCVSSLKLSISANIPHTILSVALASIRSAISAATPLSYLLSSAAADPKLIVESQRGALKDCSDLHAITLSSLSLSTSLLAQPTKLTDVRAHLAAALTNKATCLDGLAGARGPLKNTLVDSWSSAYELVSNSLAILPGASELPGRRLTGDEFPSWISRRDRRLLESSNDDDDDDDDNGDESMQGLTLTVAKDGSGNFSTIGEAIAFAPSNYEQRTIIFVKAGVYDENVDVPSYKPNIVLLGEGRDVTVIRGKRSVGGGWTTFGSATLGVSGQGFLARDLTVQNTAGPAQGQAAALRVNADFTAVYRCTIDGYQDTLYVHSFRQFYRECDIYGTVDFITGNAAAVFQGCNLIARTPIPGQSNVVTAQGRNDPNEDTGISIQNCSVIASEDLASSGGSIKTYLGRPWGVYSRTVYIESYMDGLVDPAGWTEWIGDQGLDTLYYGEYMNSGPGSGTDDRVTWAGYHVMDYDEASSFTVSEFIYGDQWLDSTSFPYDEGI